jgi:hypothetical protein
MKSIKALVILMGLLILAGLGLLVYGVVGQVSELSQTTGGPGGFDAARVALPAGCVLAAADLDGGRLVLRVDGPANQPDCQQVILLDPASGAELGRITVAPQP